MFKRRRDVESVTWQVCALVVSVLGKTTLNRPLTGMRVPSFSDERAATLPPAI